MRRRKAIVIASSALGVLLVLVLLFVSSYGPQPPEVRLLTLKPSKGYDPDVVHTQYDSLFAALPTLIGEEILVAQFEIAFAQESGSTVNGEIGYEIYGPNDEIIDKGVWKRPPTYLPFLVVERRSFAIRPKFVLPQHARGVRLAIWSRPPTLRERSQMLFQKIGFRIRHPKVADAISKLLPNRERLLKHHAEIELPPFPAGKRSTAELQTNSTAPQHTLLPHPGGFQHPLLHQ